MIDIKMPIGLMFAILGLIISIFGFITNGNTEMYERSFGININIWSGLFMLFFGGIMLVFSFYTKKKKAKKSA